MMKGVALGLAILGVVGCGGSEDESVQRKAPAPVNNSIVLGGTNQGPLPKIQASSLPVSCAHSPCVQGGVLDPLCDWAVGRICGLDPYCCGIAWDGQCVSEVATLAGQRCDCDAKCVPGPPINGYACSCVGQVSGHDDYCTKTWWDDTCVGEVATYCGVPCR